MESANQAEFTELANVITLAIELREAIFLQAASVGDVHEIRYAPFSLERRPFQRLMEIFELF